MTEDAPCPDALRKRLRLVRWVALADLLLLVALVSSSLQGRERFVDVLGPVHGGNFLLLVVLVYTGAADRLWGWWFLAATFFSGGPLGAFIGERVIVRRAAAERAGAA